MTTYCPGIDSGLATNLSRLLTTQVFVTPVSQLLGITPVLGFLLTGALIGPCEHIVRSA